MTPGLIIDCSITMAWCFADEATPATALVQDRLLTEAVLAPAHWPLEVANVLLMAAKRQRISLADAVQFLSLLQRFEIQIDHASPARAFDQVFSLGHTHQLTSYDAAYLDLALSRRLPLATLDEQLRRAAIAMGITCLGT